MTWRGIVGKSFTSIDDFSAYVDTVQFNLWRPKFVVVHNTSAPDLATYAKWQARGNPSDEQWALNLQGYYRDQMGWSAGPHLFVTPRSIIAFTPLNVPGTHTPSWNSISWGVETVGEFETEPFVGTPSHAMLVGALGVLHMKAGLSPTPYLLGQHGLHFHKEDPRTTHTSCPGRKMSKPDVLIDLLTWIADRSKGDHAKPEPPPLVA